MIAKIAILLSLFSFNVLAAKDVTECRFNLRPTGIYFNQCPRTMIAQGVDVWNPGPSPYPQVRVLCADPQIICTSLKKDLQKENN
jgi:hypothetical protein